MILQTKRLSTRVWMQFLESAQFEPELGNTVICGRGMWAQRGLGLILLTAAHQGDGRRIPGADRKYEKQRRQWRSGASQHSVSSDRQLWVLSLPLLRKCFFGSYRTESLQAILFTSGLKLPRQSFWTASQNQRLLCNIHNPLVHKKRFIRQFGIFFHKYIMWLSIAL